MVESRTQKSIPGQAITHEVHHRSVVRPQARPHGFAQAVTGFPHRFIELGVVGCGAAQAFEEAGQGSAGIADHAERHRMGAAHHIRIDVHLHQFAGWAELGGLPIDSCGKPNAECEA